MTKFSEYSFWASLVWVYACTSLSLTVHHCEEPICLLHTLPLGARLTVGRSPPQPLMALQVQPQFPPMKYNRSKRVCENTSLDYFQFCHKTVEIIFLLLKTSENFRSGAQKAPSTRESKAALSLSWAPWSGSVKDLQVLFFWYLDFLLSKDLYTVHWKNISNSLPFFPPHVSITPDTESDWLPKWPLSNPGDTGRGTCEPTRTHTSIINH